MLTSEIAARLAGKVNGYTILRGSMHDKVDTVVGIYEYTGTGPDFKFGAEGLLYEHPSFQVIVRGAATDYDGPRAVIELAVADLVKVWVTDLSGVTYNWIQPIQSPFWLRQDDKNRHYFVVNMRVEKEPS